MQMWNLLDEEYKEKLIPLGNPSEEDIEKFKEVTYTKLWWETPIPFTIPEKAYSVKGFNEQLESFKDKVGLLFYAEVRNGKVILERIPIRLNTEQFNLIYNKLYNVGEEQ